MIERAAATVIVVSKVVILCGGLAAAFIFAADRIRFRGTTLLRWIVEDVLDLGPLYDVDEEWGL